MSGERPLFFIVAGEVSGDVLAAGLIEELRLRYPKARFVGVTGSRMVAAGCESLGSIESLSLFGVGEVIGQIPRLLRFRQQLYKKAMSLRPDAFIGVDAPAFNTRLELRLRCSGVRTVHYVCPTVWAWRPGRTRTIRRAVDLVLSIFPFESAFLKDHDIPVTFVGHPLADEPSPHPDRKAARGALGLDGDSCWIGLLPGSRGSEMARLGSRFLEVASWLKQRDPSVHFVAPMASEAMRYRFERELEKFPDINVVVVDGRSREAMQAADALLVASGTATLEALLVGTPMVVAYELSTVNYWIARVLKLIKTEFVSMPNLLAGRRLVPELLQNDAKVATLGAWLFRVTHSEFVRSEQVTAFAAIRSDLMCNASARAAEAVAGLIEGEG